MPADDVDGNNAMRHDRGREVADPPVSLFRRNLLRTMFLLWAVAGLFLAVPPVLHPDPAARGMIPSMMAGLWVMGLLGVRYPLQMLPIFLFEISWKSIWLAAYGLPQWFRGQGSPRLGEDLLAIGTGPILFALVIPWPYVWQRYVRLPAERWR